MNTKDTITIPVHVLADMLSNEDLMAILGHIESIMNEYLFEVHQYGEQKDSYNTHIPVDIVHHQWIRLATKCLNMMNMCSDHSVDLQKLQAYQHELEDLQACLKKPDRDEHAISHYNEIIASVNRRIERISGKVRHRYTTQFPNRAEQLLKSM